MSDSYQLRCLERDREKAANRRLRNNILLLARYIADQPMNISERSKAEKLAFDVVGMPAPKKGEQLTLKKLKLCAHGVRVGDCNECYVASDFAYDCDREARVFGI